MSETHDLLRRYSESGSETAFRELVGGYIDLVYSVAVRRVNGDAHRAEDVVQTVFTDLARKAPSLPADVMLGGWLHRHCCFVASNVSRAEWRRQEREKEAVRMQALHDGDESTWDDLAPVVDEAVQDLPDPDREAVVLRFLERRDLKSVGACLGISEDAAQKRVSRAVDKLREIVARKGVTLSAAGLAGLLIERSVMAAPGGWASQVCGVALKGAPAQMGMAAAFLALFGSIGGKIAAVLVGVALMIGAVVWVQGPSGNNSEAKVPGMEERERATSEGSFSSVAGSAAKTTDEAAVLTEEDGTGLRLLIVAADSGAAIPNVPIDYRGWEDEKFTRKQLSSDRFGIARIPIPRETVTTLELTTRVEGFADTRLNWHPSRSQEIPREYTLRLDRAAAIGGRVTDEQGVGVAGAKVGFNPSEDPVTGSAVESHNFGWIEVETDAEGKWEINRIAPEMIRRIHGGARHPDYLNSKHIFVSQEAGAEEKLRETNYVFELRPAITVRGFVTDADGNAVAHAKVLLGNRGSSSARSGVSELDGSFEIKGAEPGENLLTAEADQFAPATVRFLAATNMEPVRITLQPGKVLRMRVVDREGRPIAGARCWLDTTFSGPLGSRDAEPPMVQAEFTPRSNDEGGVEWLQAPDRELEFDVWAKGYMRNNEVKVRPDGSEHLVVLSPALKISGTVHDAETGNPIEKFRIITGWPSGGAQGNQVSGHWSTIERFWLTFAGGKFEHQYEEPVIGGMADPSFMFKIEAEGYAPHVTRVVHPNERHARFDVVLERAEGTKITVLLPNGQPAAAADVVLARAGQMVELGVNGFARQMREVVRVTNDRGEIELQPDDSISTIYVAHADGFATLNRSDLGEERIIRLNAWGKVMGKLTRRGKPIVGRKVVFTRSNGDPRKPLLLLPQVETDAEGVFTFPKAPPGDRELAYLAPSSDMPGAFSHVRFSSVSIPPGETAEVNYSEEGTEVVVRFAWPGGAREGDGVRKFGFIQTPLQLPPAEIMQDSEALARWRELPETKAQIAKHRSWSLSEEPDGTWKSPLIPPGTYKLNFGAVEADTATGFQQVRWQAEAELNIPDDFGDDVLDLGEIPLQQVAKTP